jgi:hypothetical protein
MFSIAVKKEDCCKNVFLLSMLSSLLPDQLWKWLSGALQSLANCSEWGLWKSGWL